MSAYSVSIINEYISRLISTDPLLGNVSVTGEISNLNYHYTGHIYFSVTDRNSTLKCFYSKSYNDRLPFVLEEGMEVVLSGEINVYKKGGYYSLFVKDVQKKSEKGNLAVQFEEMKKRLEAEGLFDQAHKKPLPPFPEKIGVVTSSTGAAVEDIKRVITEKNSYVDIFVFPVQVQGENAKYSIAQMIDFINKSEEYNDIDILIVGRGGGSQEELWPFNEEIVARAIYNSKIPVISAVGHETDISISDFVADAACPTPTKAAETAVPDIKMIMNGLDTMISDMSTDLKGRLRFSEQKIDNLMESIKSDFRYRIERYSQTIEKYRIALEDNNPLKVLSKGYAVVRDENNSIIKSVDDLRDGRTVKITLKDGTVLLTAKDVRGEQNV
ncbi:MAG: exodeoxyribonuclease VII large subunit [Clostridia bacterium]|nr:exodeoxyribonuclease VII large subunit [Clostridia bacterium]